VPGTGRGCRKHAREYWPPSNVTCDLGARKGSFDGRTQEGAVATYSAVAPADPCDGTQPPLLLIPPPRPHLGAENATEAAAASGGALTIDTETPHIQIPSGPNTGQGPGAVLGGAGSSQPHGIDSIHPGGTGTPSSLAGLSPFSVADALTRLCPSPHFLWNPPPHSPDQTGGQMSPLHSRGAPFGALATLGSSVVTSSRGAPGLGPTWHRRAYLQRLSQ